jgi:signal peptidase II
MKNISNKKTALIVIFAVFFVAIDRFLKTLATKGFFDQPAKIIGDLFTWYFSANKYIAFSLPLGGVLLNILVAAIIMFLVYFWLIYYKKGEYLLIVSLTLIISGAISNLLDRLKFGYVVDYFDVKWFTIFNLADVMIVAGVILIFFYLLIAERK